MQDQDVVCYDKTGAPSGDYTDLKTALIAETAARVTAWTRLQELEAEMRRLRCNRAAHEPLYGRRRGAVPVYIYPQWLRLALTFLVPVAFATMVPAAAMAGRLTAQAFVGALGLAGVLLMASPWFWSASLRHYPGASG